MRKKFRRATRGSAYRLTAAAFAIAASVAQPVMAVDSADALRTTRDVTADLLIARPLGFIQLVVSAAMFPVAYPAGWMLGDADFAPRVCIRDPADRVFKRPLGEL